MVTEYMGTFKRVDENGNEYVLYPSTKGEVVKDQIIRTNDSVLPKTCEGGIRITKLVGGKSTQNSTTGAQLLNTVNHEVGTWEDNTGTALDDTSTYRFTDSIAVTAGETLYLSKPLVLVWVGATQDISESLEIVVPEGVSELKVRTFVADFETFNSDNYMISRAPIVKWEPYTGGMASPNMSYPHEIENASVSTFYTGNGAQLFDVNSLLVNVNDKLTISEDKYTITAVGGSNAAYVASYTMLDVNLLRGKTIYLTADSITSEQSEAYGTVQLNMTTESATSYYPISSSMLSRSIDIPNDVTSLRLNVYTNNTEKALETANTVTVTGLRVSLAECDWEPFHPNYVFAFSSPLNLPGIPVTDASLANFTDSDGQMWCTDEIDTERGVYIQRIASVTIDGSQTVETDGIEANPWRKYIWLNENLPKKSAGYQGFCNKLHYKTSTELIAGNAVENAGFNISNEYNVIYFNIAHLMTEDTVEAATTVLTENPITVYYILDTPIESKPSSSVLGILQGLKSVTGTSYIAHDCEVDLDIELLYAVSDAGAVALAGGSGSSATIGDLESLTTDSKENLVGALNEIYANALLIVSFDPSTGTLVTKSADYKG